MTAITSYPQYIEAAMRTLAHSFPKDSFQWQMGEKLLDTMHALIGLVTEQGEMLEIVFSDQMLAELPVKEELGDLWWYMALLDHTFGTGTPPINLIGEPAWLYSDVPHARGHLHRGCDQLGEQVGAAMDVVKRRIYYQAGDDSPKASWDLVIKRSHVIRSILVAMTLNADLTLEEVWSANIRKLYARYPDKFNADEALCRDLDAEIEALKG